MGLGETVYYPFARFWHNVERGRERELYADAHSYFYAMGFTRQISFYGTTTDPYDGVHYQARIELMANFDFTPKVVHILHEIFDHYKPDREYTLFVASPEGYRQVVCR